jgi:hypothetical protein
MLTFRLLLQRWPQKNKTEAKHRPYRIRIYKNKADIQDKNKPCSDPVRCLAQHEIRLAS